MDIDMEMRSELLDSIASYASESYISQILHSQEYAELVLEIIELQNEIDRLKLPDEQMQVVKRLIRENGDLYITYIEKMYKQAMIDCVVLLKNLKILQ